MQITLNLKWNSTRVALVVLVITSLFSTSCRNMFSELADKEADAALYYQAQRFIDQRLYTDAIRIIEEEINPAYAARRDVRVSLASAYVGRCGLNFLQLADLIVNDTASSSPMELALEHMGSATSEDDCVAAEGILRALSPNGDGIMSDNADDAFLMAFVGLAKIGAVLARVGDLDDDGTVDAGFDACSDLAAQDSREIGSALTLLYNNLQSTASEIATKIQAISDVCEDPVVEMAGTCGKTYADDFLPVELNIINGAVNYSPLGVGADASFTICP